LTAIIRTSAVLAAATLSITGVTGSSALAKRNGPMTSPGYQVLRRNVIINADIWNKKPEMMAAGLGFTTIIGVPNLSTSNLALTRTLAILAGGTWNTNLHCAPGQTPSLANYTSAPPPSGV